jgi:energy-coupling factor transporter ATP-binding protein EcfA2
MVAAPRLKRGDNVFAPELIGEKFPLLLKAAVIYGPNASGKSNILMALNTIGMIALRTPGAHTVLPVTPFRFDSELLNEPTNFEVHFIVEGVRYQFELSATRERITKESLTAFPRGKETLLYRRTHASVGDQYEFGEKLEGGHDLFLTWTKLTAPQTLFIAQAVANSSEHLTQLRRPFSWLTQGTYCIFGGMGAMTKISQELAEKGESHAQSIANFLQDVDVPITRIRAEAIKLQNSLASVSGEGINSLAEQKSPMAAKEAPSRVLNRMMLTHRTALGEGDISFHDESEGTKNLIGFWLPWTTREPINENRVRRVLVVDELDSSLHPKIVEKLVEKHLRSELTSQLIFTTHDTHLMDAKLLRRDQIWITERDANGATQLRSIHEFEGREGEDIEKRYYEGRYRGLPFIRSF